MSSHPLHWNHLPFLSFNVYSCSSCDPNIHPILYLSPNTLLLVFSRSTFTLKCPPINNLFFSSNQTDFVLLSIPVSLILHAALYEETILRSPNTTYTPLRYHIFAIPLFSRPALHLYTSLPLYWSWWAPLPSASQLHPPTLLCSQLSHKRTLTPHSHQSFPVDFFTANYCTFRLTISVFELLSSSIFSSVLSSPFISSFSFPRLLLLYSPPSLQKSRICLNVARYGFARGSQCKSFFRFSTSSVAEWRSPGGCFRLSFLRELSPTN